VCGPLSGGAFLPTYPGPGGYRLPPTLRGQVGGWRVAIVDDAVNAGTAVGASHSALRDAGAVPVAVAALLALGQADAFVTGTLGLPFGAAATLPSQTWPASDCPPHVRESGRAS
jgi:orotate phosphoribosyltransferase